MNQELQTGNAHKVGYFVPAQSHTERIELLSCCHCHAQIEQLTVLRCFWCLEPMCNKCWELKDGQCVRCARTISSSSTVAKAALPTRTKSFGRPRKVRKCPKCPQRFSAREMRIHKREAHGKAA